MATDEPSEYPVGPVYPGGPTWTDLRMAVSHMEVAGSPHIFDRPKPRNWRRVDEAAHLLRGVMDHKRELGELNAEQRRSLVELCTTTAEYSRLVVFPNPNDRYPEHTFRLKEAGEFLDFASRYSSDWQELRRKSERLTAQYYHYAQLLDHQALDAQLTREKERRLGLNLVNAEDARMTSDNGHASIDCQRVVVAMIATLRSGSLLSATPRLDALDRSSDVAVVRTMYEAAYGTTFGGVKAAALLAHLDDPSTPDGTLGILWTSRPDSGHVTLVGRMGGRAVVIEGQTPDRVFRHAHDDEDLLDSKNVFMVAWLPSDGLRVDERALGEEMLRRLDSAHVKSGNRTQEINVAHGQLAKDATSILDITPDLSASGSRDRPTRAQPAFALTSNASPQLEQPFAAVQRAAATLMDAQQHPEHAARCEIARVVASTLRGDSSPSMEHGAAVARRAERDFLRLDGGSLRTRDIGHRLLPGRDAVAVTDAGVYLLRNIGGRMVTTDLEVNTCMAGVNIEGVGVLVDITGLSSASAKTFGEGALSDKTPAASSKGMRTGFEGKGADLLRMFKRPIEAVASNPDSLAL